MVNSCQEVCSVKKLTYFAVLEPCEAGYGVYFPDLPGCVSMGDTYDQAIRNANEALGLHLWGMEDDHADISAPSAPPFLDVPAGSIMAAISVYPELVRHEMETRAVRMNVSIPAWLKSAAEEAGVSYSQVFQNALMEHLGIQLPAHR